MKINMRVGVKRNPVATFTLSANLEMEIWDCCHASNATQLKHEAVAIHILASYDAV